MGLGPQGGGVGVASPGPKDQWQKEPTCRPSLGLASPSHPARGLAEMARRSLAPRTKCSARRPPGFWDFEARQRGRAGGEAGGHQMPVGPHCHQHKHGLSLPASVSSLPYILLAPPPSRAAAAARPRATGHGQGGQPPLLGPHWQDPPGGPAQGWPFPSGARASLRVSPSPPAWWLWVPASFWGPLSLPLTPRVPWTFSSLKRHRKSTHSGLGGARQGCGCAGPDRGPAGGQGAEGPGVWSVSMNTAHTDSGGLSSLGLGAGGGNMKQV